MADELDERFLHKLSQNRWRCNHVDHAVHRKHHAESGHLHYLAHHSFATESWQPFVPDGSQQLLDIRMGHELERRVLYVWILLIQNYMSHLLLLVSNSQLQSFQRLSLPWLPILVDFTSVEVQHYLQFMGGSCVVQQRGCKLLALQSHFLSEQRYKIDVPWPNQTQFKPHIVLHTKLGLHSTQPPQFPGQFEGGLNGVLGAQGNQAARGQCAICIYTSLRVSQRILITRRNAFIASAAFGDR